VKRLLEYLLCALVALSIAGETLIAQTPTKIKLRRLTYAQLQTADKSSFEIFYVTDSSWIAIYDTTSGGTLVYWKIKTDTDISPTPSAIAPNLNLTIVPQHPYPNSTAVGFSPTDSGKVYVYGFTLSDSAKYVGVSVIGGTVGSATYRNAVISLYDSSRAAISHCEGFGHPGNGTSAIAGFRGAPVTGTQDTVVLGPGFYYLAFTFYTNQNTHNFRGPDMSTNSFGAVLFDSELDGGGIQWTGQATNVAATDGQGNITMPATLGTITRFTTTPRLPWMVLIPLGIGPPAQ